MPAIILTIVLLNFAGFISTAGVLIFFCSILLMGWLGELVGLLLLQFEAEYDHPR